MATSMWEHLCILRDPRVERAKLHKLKDILAIEICAAICGAESWVDIADFGQAKKARLRTFLDLPRGIPSHDVFGRLFAVLDLHGFWLIRARQYEEKGSPIRWELLIRVALGTGMRRGELLNTTVPTRRLPLHLCSNGSIRTDTGTAQGRAMER